MAQRAARIRDGKELARSSQGLAALLPKTSALQLQPRLQLLQGEGVQVHPFFEKSMQRLITYNHLFIAPRGRLIQNRAYRPTRQVV